jgi:hypothetical protein
MQSVLPSIRTGKDLDSLWFDGRDGRRSRSTGRRVLRARLPWRLLRDPEATLRSRGLPA